MLEFTKTLRNLHNLLILATTSILIICLPSAQEINPYSDALKEFKLYQKSLNEIKTSQIKYIVDDYRNKGVFDMIDQIDLNMIWDTTFYQRGKGMNFATPSYYALGNQIERIEKEDGDINFWQGELCKGKVKIESDSLSAWFQIHNKDLGDKIQWRIKSQSSDSKDAYLIISSNNSNTLKYPFECGGMVSFNNLPKGNSKKILKENSLITDESPPQYFPKLNAVFAVIKNLQIDEVEDELIRLSNENEKINKKPLTIMGLTINPLYISLIGPLLIIGLILYLNSHLIRFSKIKGNISQQETFPWIGLYSEIVPRFINYITFFILPLVSTVMCFFVAQQSFEFIFLVLIVFVIVYFSIQNIKILKLIWKNDV